MADACFCRYAEHMRYTMITPARARSADDFDADISFIFRLINIRRHEFACLPLLLPFSMRYFMMTPLLAPDAAELCFISDDAPLLFRFSAMPPAAFRLILFFAVCIYTPPTDIFDAFSTLADEMPDAECTPRPPPLLSPMIRCRQLPRRALRRLIAAAPGYGYAVA